jgi:hypothetical protein
MAYIIYPRIETIAWDGYATASVILGYVMAHEVGHLLLGPGHQPTGIMGARWNRDDLQRAACGQLCFSREQAELLRAAVAARPESQPAPGISIAGLGEYQRALGLPEGLLEGVISVAAHH